MNTDESKDTTKPGPSSVGARTPEKRYRRRDCSTSSADKGTNVSDEFVVAAKEMKKRSKNKQKYENVNFITKKSLFNDEENNMASYRQILEKKKPYFLVILK